MNVNELRGLLRRPTPPRRTFPLFALAMLVSAFPLVVTAAEKAEEAAASVGKDDDADDDMISLAAYNVKADRIEDFGLRVELRGAGHIPSGSNKQPNLATLWFSKFAPMISAVVPNTAAAKAGLRPGERILKSEGRSMVGGPFSLGPSGPWQKIQKHKWAEVAAGKTNATWTLEVETPATKAVRTVKLLVPTPPPHWGASVWRPPEGRSSSTVAEPGPLAERSRAVLDNGVWTLLDWPFSSVVIGNASPDLAPTVTAYEWRFGGGREGRHRIIVTQFRGRTDVFLNASSPATGNWVYFTSPSGVLERAWRFTRKEKGEVSLEEARAGFEHALDFWTTKVVTGTGRWPFEVKPGYDANAAFATKDGATASEVARPFADEFLKLPTATEAQRLMFADAFGKLGAEPDRWAYTETSRGFEDKRVIVTRVDPSKPEAQRCVLLSINGKSPTPADAQSWRDEGGDVPKPLGDFPSLATLVDLKDLRVFKDETAAVVFELPLQSGNSDFPAEKFQALLRVNKTQRAFEDIRVKLRDSFRIAGVAKVTDAGMELRFQTLDTAYPPQPVLLKGGGAARIVLVKIARRFETTRTDFKRVTPFDEGATPGK